MHEKRVAYIKAKLDVIEAERVAFGDCERVHFQKAALWEMALNWIALGDDDAANLAELASLALRTEKIEFAR